MAAPKLHSMYVPHERVQVEFPDDGMTRQEFAEESDINVLMARYEKIGGMLPPPTRQPVYFDASDMPADFQDALNRVIAAEEAFMSLPATARRDMGNDPAQFVAFASDPANLPKLREWGLAAPEAAPVEPTLVRVVSDPDPKAGA